MDPNVWGPQLWEVMFSLLIRSPDEARVDLLLSLRLMEAALPCPHCRKSYSLYRKTHDVTSLPPNKEELSKWLWAVHELVNQKLGKISISYPTLLKKHDCLHSPASDWTLVDALSLSAFGADQSPIETDREDVMSLIRILSKWWKHCSSGFAASCLEEELGGGGGDDSSRNQKEGSFDLMWRVRNKVASKYGEEEVGLGEYKLQIAKGIADKVITPKTVPPSRSEMKRRRHA